MNGVGERPPRARSRATARSWAPNFRSGVADTQLRSDVLEYVTVYGCLSALGAITVAVTVAAGDTAAAIHEALHQIRSIVRVCVLHGISWLRGQDAPDLRQGPAGVGRRQKVELPEGSGAEHGCRGDSQCLFEGAACGLTRRACRSRPVLRWRWPSHTAHGYCHRCLPAGCPPRTAQRKRPRQRSRDDPRAGGLSRPR